MHNPPKHNLYLRNYQDIASLLQPDLEPTPGELNTAIFQMRVQFPNTPIEDIIANLRERVQFVNAQQIANSQRNGCKSEVISLVYENEQNFENYAGQQEDCLSQPSSIQGIYSFMEQSEDSQSNFTTVKEKYSKKARKPRRRLGAGSVSEQGCEQPPQPKIKYSKMYKAKLSSRLHEAFNHRQTFKYQKHHHRNEVWEGGIKTANFSKQQMLRYKQKQLAARALAFRGYGYTALKQQIAQAHNKIKIPSDRYKVVSYSMITDVYRNIQQYIKQKFSQKHQPLNCRELRPLHPILLNALKEFPKRQADTFRKFLIITFDLNPERMPEMTGIDVMELHQYIQYLLYQKNLRQLSKPKSVSLDPSQIKPQTISISSNNPPITAQRKPQQFWTPQRQKLLVQFFHQERSLGRVKQRFKLVQKDLNSVTWFDYNFMKNRMDKMIRQVIRKMQIQINQDTMQFNRTFDINDARIKEITKSPEALEIKLILTQIYKDGSFTEGNIRYAMRLIVEFFDRKSSHDFLSY